MNGKKRDDSSHHPYGMDFAGGCRPDPTDEAIVAVLMGQPQGNSAARVEISDLADGCRSYIRSDNNAVGYSVDLDNDLVDMIEARGMTPEDVAAMLCADEKTRNGGTEPAVAFLRLEEKCCDLCNQTPCFLLQVDPEFSQDSNLMELLSETGDELVHEGKSSREIRYKLYRIATKFVNGYLGKGNRVPLPPCVIGDIKDSFPASVGTTYTGFKKGFLNK
jgi:hypothetical protein